MMSSRGQKTFNQLRNFYDAGVPIRAGADITEIQAANKTERFKVGIRERALHLLIEAGRKGLTGSELIALMGGGKESTIRTRLGELVQYGLAEDTLVTRPNANGNEERVRVVRTATAYALNLYRGMP